MKPDFMLTMMFIGILLFPESAKCIFTCCDNGCYIRAFFKFPGGLIPNVIDKFITAFVIYAIIIAFKKLLAT